MSTSSTLHLLLGPVGSGKTTYGRHRAVAESMVFLDLDVWMVRLFGEDPRPSQDVMAWYLERRQRCQELLWDVTRDILASGADVLLELGLVRQVEREAFFRRARLEGIELRIYLLDASREARRERVMKRNRSQEPHTQVVPAEYFELASDAWEPPSLEERELWNMLDV